LSEGFRVGVRLYRSVRDAVVVDKEEEEEEEKVVVAVVEVVVVVLMEAEEEVVAAMVVVVSEEIDLAVVDIMARGFCFLFDSSIYIII
jgi:hypothetical protein